MLKILARLFTGSIPNGSIYILFTVLPGKKEQEARNLTGCPICNLSARSNFLPRLSAGKTLLPAACQANPYVSAEKRHFLGYPGPS